MTPKIMKMYEKSSLKLHRFLDGFSRALDTENDPKNLEKVWKKYLKSGAVSNRFQSSFSYRKWPQKSWKKVWTNLTKVAQKVGRYLDGFSRALATEHDPENRETKKSGICSMYRTFGFLARHFDGFSRALATETGDFPADFLKSGAS